MPDIRPELIEKAADGLHGLYCDPPCTHQRHPYDGDHLQASVALCQAADDLRAEGFARALDEVSDSYTVPIPVNPYRTPKEKP